MSILKRFRTKTSLQQSEKVEAQPEDNMLFQELQKNIQKMDEIFKDSETLIKRSFSNQKNPKIKCCALFFDEMIDKKTIDEYIIKPIMLNNNLLTLENIAKELSEKVIVTRDVKNSCDINEITQELIYGNTVLLIDGSKSALIISTKGWQTRAIAEPDTEKVLRGPREGFTEGLLINLSMIRRRLCTSDLKFKFRTFGTKSNTKACICYLESIVDKKILAELYRRLDNIKIDGVLDANYINELIKDSPFSLFKTIGVTERPDVVSSKLLEGRIAIFLDGTPVALTVPYLFIENFQAGDDYYLNYYFGSLGRILRILGFVMSITIPSIYVAFTTYHREMIPTELSLSIMEAHEGVPFPTILESIIMLITFEIIRETGLRMPSNIGQALNIVGALVIGQAAVDARLISAPMVIVIALTAITGLINPKVKGAVIIIRFLVLFSTAFLGIFGLMFSLIGVLIHLYSMQSFGVIYMYRIASYSFSDIKDYSFRAPWHYMKSKPAFKESDMARKD